MDPNSRQFRGVNALLSWVYSGGSVLEKTKVPYITVHSDADEVLLKRAGSWAGVDIDMARSGGDGRAREFRTGEHGSIFSRFLLVLGAPLGDKNPRNEITLPDYLDKSPPRVRREFLQIYLRNRGNLKPDTNLLRIRENRSEGYLQSLARLFKNETGESVSVSDKNVILSVAATKAVGSWDPVLGH